MTDTPDNGALTVDAAIASLLPAEPVEQEAPAAPVEAAQEPTEPEGETSAPEEAEAEPVEPAEGEEAEAEPEPVVAAEPPKYWSQDAKAKFAELPPELQAVVLAQEGPREEAAAKAKAEAAAKVAEAQAEVGKVTQLAEQLADFLPQAVETFKSRWGTDPDWVAYAHEHGAEAMTIAKAQHEAELSQLSRLAAAKQEAETQAHQAFLKVEFAKLAEIAPDLAQDATKRQAVVSYLVQAGVPQDALPQISAVEMTIAHKAKLWDEAQAKLKAAPKPAPVPAAKPAPVRPAASQAQSPQRSVLQQAQARFNLNPSRENAEALLLAQRA